MTKQSSFLSSIHSRPVTSRATRKAETAKECKKPVGLGLHATRRAGVVSTANRCKTPTPCVRDEQET